MTDEKAASQRYALHTTGMPRSGLLVSTSPPKRSMSTDTSRYTSGGKMRFSSPGRAGSVVYGLPSTNGTCQCKDEGAQTDQNSGEWQFSVDGGYNAPTHRLKALFYAHFCNCLRSVVAVIAVMRGCCC